MLCRCWWVRRIRREESGDRTHLLVHEHEAVLEMSFAGAEVEAAAGKYAMALRWLAVAERLGLMLPPEQALRREQWRQALHDRIDGQTN